MSSILVRGMEMPHCCVVCPLKEMYPDGLLCKATNPHKYIPNFFHKRYEKCPLVEVSTPHGDLIDRSLFIGDTDPIDRIWAVPAVIEAESHFSHRKGEEVDWKR